MTSRPPTTNATGERSARRLVGIGAAAALVASLLIVTTSVAPADAAALTVNTASDTVADDGECSLREAITAANSDSASGATTGECPAGDGADTITFGVSGPVDVTLGGLPQIGSELVIDGGVGVTIDAGGASRVFFVNGSGDATFESLTISGGRAKDGAGILNLGGAMTVTNSTLTANEGTGATFYSSGGAILNVGGNLEVTTSTFSQNTMEGDGGAIANISGAVTIADSSFSGNVVDSGNGGAISSTGGGSLDITGSTISGNRTGGTGFGGRGGGLANVNSAVTVTGTTLHDNRAGSPGALGQGGGGIYTDGGSMSVTGSTLTANRDRNTDGGGGIYGDGPLTVVDSTISGSWSNGISGVGSLADSVVTDSTKRGVVEFDSIVGSTISDNATGGVQGTGDISGSVVSGNSGAGVDTGVTLDATTITDSVISANTAGGVHNTGSMTIAGSTISGNGADRGGGILNTGFANFDPDLGELMWNPAALTVSNSTISGNTATTSGGGIQSGGSFFGAPALGDSLLTVEFSTVTDNAAPVGAGISTWSSGASTAMVAGSIIAANTNDDVHFDAAESDPFVSGGYNVIGDGNAADGFAGPGDVTGLDPRLGPLADNGGPTATHALAVGSPAVDRVTATLPGDVTVDQRGVARPLGAAKDAGAFELEPVLTPGGAWGPEGDNGTLTVEVPINLSGPLRDPVLIDWATHPWSGPGFADAGVDYIASSGTVTIPAGQTSGSAPVEIHGDTLDEFEVLGGEILFVRFFNPSDNAVLDTSFFGLGAYVIQNDDD